MPIPTAPWKSLPAVNSFWRSALAIDRITGNCLLLTLRKHPDNPLAHYIWVLPKE
jgi:hypothetical protein